MATATMKRPKEKSKNAVVLRDRDREMTDTMFLKRRLFFSYFVVAFVHKTTGRFFGYLALTQLAREKKRKIS